MARRLSQALLSSSRFWISSPAFSAAGQDLLCSGQQLISLRALSTAAASTNASLASLPQSTPSLQLSGLLQIYKQLSKAKLSALVVSTAAAGFVAGSGSDIHWAALGWTSLGTMGTAAAANALNQLREVHQDSLMKRTQRRPLPMGRLSRLHALAFAGVTGLAGVTLLGVKASWLAASLAAANIGLYAGVYTSLKMVSPLNTWVGAIVGAVPPLIGWAAATGQLDAGAGVFAGLLYFWQLYPAWVVIGMHAQIPHFLSLAWLCRADYVRGGFQMLSTADPSGRRTGACMLRNCLYLLPLGPASLAAGFTGPVFAVGASVATAVLAATAAVFARNPSPVAARAVFRGSLVYLPVVLAIGLMDRVPRREPAAHHAEQCESSLSAEGEGSQLPDAQEERFQHGSPGTLAVMPPFPFLPVPVHMIAAPPGSLASMK